MTELLFLNVLISVEYATHSFRAPSLGYCLQQALLFVTHKAALILSKPKMVEFMLLLFFFLWIFLTPNRCKIIGAIINSCAVEALKIQNIFTHFVICWIEFTVHKILTPIQSMHQSIRGLFFFITVFLTFRFSYLMFSCTVYSVRQTRPFNSRSLYSICMTQTLRWGCSPVPATCQ